MATRKAKPCKENRNRSGSDPQDVGEQEETGRGCSLFNFIVKQELMLLEGCRSIGAALLFVLIAILKLDSTV